MHEEGRADHELIDEGERDRFAGTSAEAQTADDDRFADRSSGSDDDRDRSATGSEAAGERPMHEPDTEYERGREDERRFEREQESERPDVRRA
jgi:hypothetical protein